MVTGFLLLFSPRFAHNPVSAQDHAMNIVLHSLAAGVLHPVRGVAEVALQGLGIVPRVQRHHGVRMPQIVKSSIGPSDSGGCAFEVPIDDMLRQVLADLVGENVAGVLPHAARSLLHGVLL